MKTKFVLFIVAMLSIFPAFSQEEWEDATPSGLKWDIDLKLTWYSTSLNELKVANLIPETKEDKKNNQWRSYTAKLNYQIKETRPFEMTVNVTNLNNRADYKYAVYDGKKQKWHTKNIYWGYEIGVNTTSGGTDYYQRDFSDKKSDSYSYSTTSFYDSDTRSWNNYYEGKSHSLKIEYDGDHTIKVYDNSTCVKTFYNAKSICYFGFKAGTASQIYATNFKVRRKSNYGMAKPRIDDGMVKMQKEDWFNASRDFTYVIETLKYVNYDVLFARGFAYAMREQYRSAIDDFTKALSQTGITNDNRESAYYLRGLCKANLGDDDCVNDMRKAGQDGKVWLKENNLENYVVGSSSTNTQSNNQSSSVHRFLPEKFRK
jgi:predicted hydrocarbon binding protein